MSGSPDQKPSKQFLVAVGHLMERLDREGGGAVHQNDRSLQTSIQHPGMKVREVLLLSDAQLAEIFADAPTEVRGYLRGELAVAHEIIPCGPRCSEWSYSCGCRGHME